MLYGLFLKEGLWRLLAMIISKRGFISYRRTTKGESSRMIANSVHKSMKEKGFDLFYDFGSMSVGNFSQQIRDNILVRPHFLFVLTHDTLIRTVNDNDWIRRELQWAMRHNRHFIILRNDGISVEEAIEEARNNANDENDQGSFEQFLESFATYCADGETTSSLEVTAETIASDIEKISEIIKAKDCSKIDVHPELLEHVSSIRRRVLICYAQEDHSADEDVQAIKEEFSKGGFDAAIADHDQTSFKLIYDRDVIIVYITRTSLRYMAGIGSYFYRQILFALENDKEIIPIFREQIGGFELLPTQLMLLPLMNAYEYKDNDDNQCNDNYFETIFKTHIAPQLVGPRPRPNDNETLSEHFRQKGLMAASNKRYEESDTYFRNAKAALHAANTFRNDEDKEDKDLFYSNGQIQLTRGIVRYGRAQNDLLNLDSDLLDLAIADFEAAKKASDLHVVSLYLARATFDRGLHDYQNSNINPSNAISEDIEEIRLNWKRASDLLLPLLPDSDDGEEHMHETRLLQAIILAHLAELESKLNFIETSQMYTRRAFVEFTRALSNLASIASIFENTDRSVENNELYVIAIGNLHYARVMKMIQNDDEFNQTSTIKIKGEMIEAAYRQAMKYYRRFAKRIDSPDKIDQRIAEISAKLSEFIIQYDTQRHHSGELMSNLSVRMIEAEQELNKNADQRQSIVELLQDFDNNDALQTKLLDYDDFIEKQLQDDLILKIRAIILRTHAAIQENPNNEEILPLLAEARKLAENPLLEGVDSEIDGLINLNEAAVALRTGNGGHPVPKLLSAMETFKQANQHYFYYLTVLNLTTFYLAIENLVEAEQYLELLTEATDPEKMGVEFYAIRSQILYGDFQYAQRAIISAENTYLRVENRLNHVATQYEESYSVRELRIELALALMNMYVNTGQYNDARNVGQAILPGAEAFYRKDFLARVLIQYGDAYFEDIDSMLLEEALTQYKRILQNDEIDRGLRLSARCKLDACKAILTMSTDQNAALEQFNTLEEDTEWEDDFDDEVKAYKHYFCAKIYQENGDLQAMEEECQKVSDLIEEFEEDELTAFFMKMQEKLEELCHEDDNPSTQEA